MPRFQNFTSIFTSHLGHPISLTLYVANVLAIGHCVVTYGITNASPMGPSMLPTHAIYGEGLLISKSHRYGRNIRVGDAVAFKIPTDPDAEAIKRVLGMPGDYVLVDAQYIPSAFSHDPSPRKRKRDDGATMMQVPEGHCWVVGDNLPVSRDSRLYGPVPLGLIRGKIIAQLLPLREMRWVRNPLDEDVVQQGDGDEDVD